MDPEIATFSTTQARVVELPADARTVVIAPAGTGKTHVLIGRIRHLIDKEGLSPAQELLVLSFSRAAVREISRRIRLTTGAIGYLRASTFDSFATQLLSAYDPGGTWIASTYDERIRRATEVVREGTEDLILGDIRHVMVDEIQDLVGVRRDFVGALLDHTSVGFTLLGDPSQAIYDWQEDSVGGPRVQPILEWLERRYDFELIRFEKDFRSLTDTTRSALKLGQLLERTPTDVEGPRDAIVRFVNALPRIESFNQLKVVVRGASGVSAVLCRTNGQALAISKTLYELGVDHQLQRRADDRAVTPIVARLLGDAESTSLSRREFEERSETIVDDVSYSVDELWRLLIRLSPRNPSVLDLGKIGERIRLGLVPEELNVGTSGQLVVSTVHRSKGLEFDSVFLVEPQYRDELSPSKLVDELRVTYVGLSRARRHIYMLRSPDVRFLRHCPSVGRWVKTGREQWHRFGIEVRGTDVEWRTPPVDAAKGLSAKDVQRYLSENVRKGDPVELRLAKAGIGDTPRAIYSVVHDQVQIGTTSEEFARDLFAVLKIGPTWRVNWPQLMTGLHIEMLDTVAGGTAASANAGLGPSGIWLRPRISGLADFLWEG